MAEDPESQVPHSPDDGDAQRCSAKGCREPALFELHWRNPSIHDSSRVKVWLACADHSDSLADFLARRGFLLDRQALAK